MYLNWREDMYRAIGFWCNGAKFFEKHLATTVDLAARQTVLRLTADTASSQNVSVACMRHQDENRVEDRQRLVTTSTGLHFSDVFPTCEMSEISPLTPEKDLRGTTTRGAHTAVATGARVRATIISDTYREC